MTPARTPGAPSEGEAGVAPGRDFQLDLATALVRLEQLADYGDGFPGAGVEALAYLLWRRIVECDLPRLRGHLSPTMAGRIDALIAELDEAAGPATESPRDGSA